MNATMLAPDTVMDISSPEELDQHLKRYFDPDYRSQDKPRLFAGYDPIAGAFFIRCADSEIKLIELEQAFRQGYRIWGMKSILVKKR